MSVHIIFSPRLKSALHCSSDTGVWERQCAVCTGWANSPVYSPPSRLDDVVTGVDVVVLQVISVHLADISSHAEYLAFMGLSGSCISATQM